MSATITITDAARHFPVGTTVGAYPWNQDGHPASGAPPVATTDTSPVGTNGHLVFNGLVEGQRYLAAALVVSDWVYVSFTADADSTDSITLSNDLSVGDDATVTDDLAVGGDATITGACNITGALNHDGTTVGFYGVTPATRPTAYTQTYNTSAKTVPAATFVDAATTAVTQTTPWGFASQAQGDAVATKLNALGADVLALKKVITAIIDDLQSVGLAQ